MTSKKSRQSTYVNSEHFFKKVKISAIAMIKMLINGIKAPLEENGNTKEVMGCIRGKVSQDAFIITDVVPLPVEGAETHVNAGYEAQAYMLEYLEFGSKVGKPEMSVGWFHTHPGLTCFLSGIDVATQRLNQQTQEPFLAIVVDPINTLASGRINVKCFRTFTEKYANSTKVLSDNIPSDKLKDFGAFADKYYQLEHSFYKSPKEDDLLEVLWSKYWIESISACPTRSLKDYTTKKLEDIAVKAEMAEIGNEKLTNVSALLSSISGEVGNALSCELIKVI